MEKMLLNGIWNMTQCGETNSYSAQIPGSVLSTLLNAKAIDDPYNRMNEYQTRELFRNDYCFEREFELSKDFLSNEYLELICEGLDTLAEIFINDTHVTDTNNMHRTWRIPAKEYLKAGGNTIRIIFRSTLQYMENYSYAPEKEIHYTSCGAMTGNQVIRKAHSMFGWDWGPQLPDAGIWRDIYLIGYCGSRIDDIFVHQVHHAAASVTLQTKISLTEETLTDNQRSLLLLLTDKEANAVIDEQTITLTGDSSYECSLEVPDAKLWYPNGYGSQPLYELTIRLLDADAFILEEHQKTIGLRTLTVSREADQWGREFAFVVNGIKIFTMGGNYIPEDCVYSNITIERQEYLLTCMKRAHFNCVRIWGGGYYPSDAFYELCDRLGLIVWQDLMYACNVYDVTEEFAENCRQEAIDNLKRLRHHASLGLICGNNEIESAWLNWKDFRTESPYLKADYIKLFEDVLPKASRQTAPDTFYWNSSPSSGGCFDNPDDENNGDTHYWEVWHGQKPFTDYRNYYFRFCSEFGFQSFPCMKTIETFTEPEERNIFSRTMESHQKNDAANGKILYYLSENFRYPSSFDHLLYVSQILQGMAMKYGVDHWRRYRNRCMGTLYWQVNDNWPVASWSSIDYFGRWKALHYMACHFYAPVAPSLVLENDNVCLFMANETTDIQTCMAHICVKDMQCHVLYEISEEVTVPAFRSEMVLTADLKKLPQYLELQKEVRKNDSFDEQIFIEGTLTLENGSCVKDVETLLPYKYLYLPKPEILTEVTETDDSYQITLTGNAFAAFVELDFADADVIFSDNYFHLTDTQTMEITLSKKDILRGTFTDAEDVKKRLRIRSLVDSY